MEFDCPIDKLDCVHPEKCENGCVRERSAVEHAAHQAPPAVEKVYRLLFEFSSKNWDKYGRHPGSVLFVLSEGEGGKLNGTRIDIPDGASPGDIDANRRRLSTAPGAAGTVWIFGGKFATINTKDPKQKAMMDAVDAGLLSPLDLPIKEATVFMILMRDGTEYMACCHAEDGKLVRQDLARSTTASSVNRVKMTAKPADRSIN